ncbi:MAG: RHS repeat-associated core domain-containing protein [Vicinamibacteria bacterium]
MLARALDDLDGGRGRGKLPPCAAGFAAEDPQFQNIHADGLGSIVATTDAAGNVTSRRQYDTWGNLELGADQPGYAFTGREWDPETGLYYYRARYYDLKLGRFISEDPIGLGGGINSYSYVGNQPVNATDPMGLMPDPEAERWWAKGQLDPDQWEKARKIIALEREHGSEYVVDLYTGFFSDASLRIHAYSIVHPKFGVLDLDYANDLLKVSSNCPALSGAAYRFERWVNHTLIRRGELGRGETYPNAYQDPGEVNLVKALKSGATFEDLLSPLTPHGASASW